MIRKPPWQSTFVLDDGRVKKAMKLFSWIFSRWSHRQRAMALYRQGMEYAKTQDHQAALAVYTAVIDMIDAPADLRAMALYNRSLVYASIDNDAQAIRDLRQLLETSGATENVRLEAKRKLVRMARASNRSKANPRPDA